MWDTYLVNTVCADAPTHGPSPLQWRHNECDGVSNLQHHACLLNSLFRRRSKKTSKLGVTGLCEGNSPVTGEFPHKTASNAENVSIWWRHHDITVAIVLTNWRKLTHCGLLMPYSDKDRAINIGSGNALVPGVTKPLPEPMRT